MCRFWRLIVSGRCGQLSKFVRAWPLEVHTHTVSETFVTSMGTHAQTHLARSSVGDTSPRDGTPESYGVTRPLVRPLRTERHLDSGPMA